MSIATESATRSEITVQGVTLTVPAPFVEGHVLRANEAGVLNQTYAENLRNNFAAAVKKAKDEAEKAGTAVDGEKLQSELDAYVVTYDFGIRRGGGVRVGLTPVEKEARKLAREAITAALSKKGHKVKDLPEGKMDEFIEQALATKPAFREEAQRRVEARQNIGAELLGDM